MKIVWNMTSICFVFFSRCLTALLHKRDAGLFESESAVISDLNHEANLKPLHRRRSTYDDLLIRRF